MKLKQIYKSFIAGILSLAMALCFVPSITAYAQGVSDYAWVNEPGDETSYVHSVGTGKGSQFVNYYNEVHGTNKTSVYGVSNESVDDFLFFSAVMSDTDTNEAVGWGAIVSDKDGNWAMVEIGGYDAPTDEPKNYSCVIKKEMFLDMDYNSGVCWDCYKTPANDFVDDYDYTIQVFTFTGSITNETNPQSNNIKKVGSPVSVHIKFNDDGSNGVTAATDDIDYLYEHADDAIKLVKGENEIDNTHSFTTTRTDYIWGEDNGEYKWTYTESEETGTLYKVTLKDHECAVLSFENGAVGSSYYDLELDSYWTMDSDEPCWEWWVFNFDGEEKDCYFWILNDDEYNSTNVNVEIKETCTVYEYILSFEEMDLGVTSFDYDYVIGGGDFYAAEYEYEIDVDGVLIGNNVEHSAYSGYPGRKFVVPAGKKYRILPDEYEFNDFFVDDGTECFGEVAFLIEPSTFSPFKAYIYATKEGEKICDYQFFDSDCIDNTNGNSDITCYFQPYYGLKSVILTDVTNEHNHALTQTIAKAATCTAAGNKAYWTCSDCEKIFKDKDGNEEFASLAETVIPATGHKLTVHAAVEATATKDGNIAYWTCDTCGKFFSDKDGKTEIKEADTVIPAKGEPTTEEPTTEEPTTEEPATEAPVVTTGTLTAEGIYCAQDNPTIIAAFLTKKSNEDDIVEYRWVACEESNPSIWFEVSPWTENNYYLSWTPDEEGDYIIVAQARIVGNEEKTLVGDSFGVNYKKKNDGGNVTEPEKIISQGIYCAQTSPSIVAGLVVDNKDSIKGDIEYQWLVCDESTGAWAVASDWTKNNEWMNYTPAKSGNYIFVCNARIVGQPESNVQFSFGTPFKREGGIKQICQMPGENGGYVIGFESYENPNQSYKYQMLVLDLSLLAAGSPTPWVFATDKLTLPAGATPEAGRTMWTVWTPEYGYYITLFRLYDADDNLLDEISYGFVNAY